MGSKAFELAGSKGPRLRVGPAVFPIFVVLLALCLGMLVVVGQSPYQTPDQVRLRDAEKIALFLKPRLRDGDIVYVEWNVRKPLEYYFLKHDVPMRYLYFPELENRSHGPVKRAFVIDARKEGSLYGIQNALKCSNLEIGRGFACEPLVRFGYSTVYVINNPTVQSGPG